MLRSKFHDFIEDESGAYTVWSLIWFSLYVAIGGLAVDMTDAYRTKSILQSTADASALAAVMSLPNEADGRSQAVAYSKDNMLQNINGTVLRSTDVTFGTYEIATRTFTAGEQSNLNFLKPDAAMVVTKRADDNENPLGTNFLRIIGLMEWDVNTTAIAIKYIPECIRGGFVALNRVDTNSNNYYYNNICIHGQNVPLDNGQNYAVEVQNGSVFDPGVRVSMPRMDELSRMPQVYSNTGLQDAHTPGDVYPADVAKLDEIIAGLTDLTLDNPYRPAYINLAPTDGLPVIINETNSFSGPYVAGHIYDISCSGGSDLTLPTNTVIQDVVIVSECGIRASNGLSLTNVAIASKGVGNGQNPLSSHQINFASRPNLGDANFCTNGGNGGVEIYAKASAHIAAGTVASGIRIVVGGDLELTAQVDILGVAAQAGNDIDHTSNGAAGLCPNGTVPPGVYAFHHRLVY